MMFRLGDVEFGGRFGDLVVEDFQPGEAELVTNDNARPQRDGVLVGRDFLGAANWAFDVATNMGDVEGARAAAGALARVWLSEATRQTPNVTVPLSYQLEEGGPWRRVYGRPGKYAGPTADVLMRQGVGRINADFRVTDPLHYADTETKVELQIVPATAGGIVAPIVAPVSTLATSGVRAGFVNNGGDAPTPLRVTFYGPVTDPWVRAAAGWEIGLEGSIAYDRSVTVDARAGTVTRNGGAPVNGMLTRKTRLSAARLPVGESELTFGGKDATGTARVRLAWSDAHLGI